MTRMLYSTLLFLLLAQPANAQSKYPVECEKKDGSVPMPTCVERLKLNAPRLTECKNLSGDDYRVCAVGIPYPAYALVPAPPTPPLPAHASTPIPVPFGTKRLPTPQEAVQAFIAKAKKEGNEAAVGELESVYKAAHKLECEAVANNQADIVAPEDANLCKLEPGIQQSDNKIVEIDGHLFLLKREGPPSYPFEVSPRSQSDSGCLIRKGMTSSQVWSCMGRPSHINSDFYLDQYVYGDSTYVYIDRRTDKVINMQWSSN